MLLSMVLRDDEDIIPETNGTDKEKEAFPVVISILQCIKCSEDVVDPLKSKVKKNMPLRLLIIFYYVPIVRPAQNLIWRW